MRINASAAHMPEEQNQKDRSVVISGLPKPNLDSRKAYYLSYVEMIKLKQMQLNKDQGSGINFMKAMAPEQFSAAKVHEDFHETFQKNTEKLFAKSIVNESFPNDINKEVKEKVQNSTIKIDIESLQQKEDKIK